MQPAAPDAILLYRCLMFALTVHVLLMTLTVFYHLVRDETDKVDTINGNEQTWHAFAIGLVIAFFA